MPLWPIVDNNHHVGLQITRLWNINFVVHTRQLESLLLDPGKTWFRRQVLALLLLSRLYLGERRPLDSRRAERGAWLWACRLRYATECTDDRLRSQREWAGEKRDMLNPLVETVQL